MAPSTENQNSPLGLGQNPMGPVLDPKCCFLSSRLFYQKLFDTSGGQYQNLVPIHGKINMTIIAQSVEGDMHDLRYLRTEIGSTSWTLELRELDAPTENQNSLLGLGQKPIGPVPDPNCCFLSSRLRRWKLFGTSGGPYQILAPTHGKM